MSKKQKSKKNSGSRRQAGPEIAKTLPELLAEAVQDAPEKERALIGGLAALVGTTVAQFGQNSDRAAAALERIAKALEGVKARLDEQADAEADRRAKAEG